MEEQFSFWMIVVQIQETHSTKMESFDEKEGVVNVAYNVQEDESLPDKKPSIDICTLTSVSNQATTTHQQEVNHSNALH